MLKKLKNKKGETISEVLVASLVVAMAFVMVASMISVSYKTIQKTDDAMATYYTEHNEFEAGTAASTTGMLSVTTTGSGNATTISDNNISVSIDTEEVGTGTNQKLYVKYEAVK